MFGVFGGGTGGEEFLYNCNFLPLGLQLSVLTRGGGEGGTDWPDVVAISLRDLKTPGTVRGEGLNIVGCAPFDFYNQRLSSFFHGLSDARWDRGWGVDLRNIT